MYSVRIDRNWQIVLQEACGREHVFQGDYWDDRIGICGTFTFDAGNDAVESFWFTDAGNNTIEKHSETYYFNSKPAGAWARSYGILLKEYVGCLVRDNFPGLMEAAQKDCL